MATHGNESACEEEFVEFITTHAVDTLGNISVPHPGPHNEIKRLLLIDGMDVMKTFADMGITESKFSPVILVPLISSLFKKGYCTRVFLKSLNMDEQCADWFIIEYLHTIGILIIGDAESGKQESDCELLDLAKKLGAAIISNDDKLTSTRDGYEEEIKRIIKYEKIATNLLSEDIPSEKVLEKCIVYKYVMKFVESAGILMVDSLFGDKCEFNLVLESYKSVEPIRKEFVGTFSVLKMFLQTLWSFAFNMKVPDSTKAFVSFDAPLTFKQFVKDFVNYQRRQLDKQSDHSWEYHSNLMRLKETESFYYRF